MARYFVIHRTPIEGDQDALVAAARRVKASLPGEVEWLNSWWLAGDENKLFCEWEAPDRDTIWALLGPVKALLPVESIHLVTRLDPAWYE